MAWALDVCFIRDTEVALRTNGVASILSWSIPECLKRMEKLLKKYQFNCRKKKITKITIDTNCCSNTKFKCDSVNCVFKLSGEKYVW